jgi:parallel beta-helix repeat protein
LNNSCDNNTIDDNIVHHNGYRGTYFTSMSGIFLDHNSVNNSIRNNNVSYSSRFGIGVWRSNENKMIHNKILNNGDDGINLCDADRNKILDGNDVSSNRDDEGIHFYEDTNNNEVINNTIHHEMMTGITLGSSQYICKSPPPAGAEVNSWGALVRTHHGAGTNNSIRNNSIYHNGVNPTWRSPQFIYGNGIDIYMTSNTTVANNTIYSNIGLKGGRHHAVGILIEMNSSNNTIENNTIRNNSHHGISIFNSWSNTIRRNIIEGHPDAPAARRITESFGVWEYPRGNIKAPAPLSWWTRQVGDPNAAISTNTIIDNYMNATYPRGRPCPCGYISHKYSSLPGEPAFRGDPPGPYKQWCIWNKAGRPDVPDYACGERDGEPVLCALILWEHMNYDHAYGNDEKGTLVNSSIPLWISNKTVSSTSVTYYIASSITANLSLAVFEPYISCPYGCNIRYTPAGEPMITPDCTYDGAELICYDIPIEISNTELNVLTITVRKEELLIEAKEYEVGEGEDIVLWVRGNPKTYYYLTVTGVHEQEPPEIKAAGDVKALSENAVISADAPNLAAWVQTGGEGIAEVEIATTGADDRAYTIHVYETTAVLNPDAVGGPTYATDAVVAASALTTDDDYVDIKVVEAKVTFDMPAIVVIGEEVAIRGIVTVGDTIDILIDDGYVAYFDNEPVNEYGEFEVDWDTTCGLTPGSYSIDGYIDCPYDSYDEIVAAGIYKDGSIVIMLVVPGLNAEQLRNVVAEDDDYEIEGTATGVDDVDIVLIGPKGYPFSDPGLDVANGLYITSTSVTDTDDDDYFEEDIWMRDGLDLGIWRTMVFSPGCDKIYGDLGLGAGELEGIPTTWFAGKTQDQIVAILMEHTIDVARSDDLYKMLEFKVESPYVRLDPIAPVAVGEPLYISGTTNREPGMVIVIWTFAGPVELPPETVEVEWPTPDGGVFSGTIDTSEAVPGRYTFEADDGDGHTDTAIVEIWRSSTAI